MLILGGGMTGLVVAQLLDYEGHDIQIFTNSMPNQHTMGLSLGPRILHQSNNTDKFLASLDLYPLPKKYKIGYYYDGEVHEVADEEQRKSYILKTRGFGSLGMTSAMSEGKNEIIGYDIDKIGLYDVLYQKFKDKIHICQIDTKKIAYCDYDNKIYGLDTHDPSIAYCEGEVISTINLLSYNIAKDVYFTHAHHVANHTMDGFDYIYFTEENHYWNRITTIADGYVIESNEALTDDSIKVPTQIRNNVNLDKFNGIKMIGRYAQIKHGVRLDTIIRDFYEKGCTFG